MVLSWLGRVRGVVLVGVLVAALLSLVGVSGAANTAVEGGVDDDGDRSFADASRYGSSVKLAQAYLASGAGFEDEVVVVSGESLVDAIGAVGLAASREAAIVLTPSDGLTRAVSRFVGGDEERAGFGTATIVGGTSAVSGDVAAELEALEDVAEVNRISGEDRYESAVAAAEAAGDAGRWCGADGASVFVVSGESLVDGVMVAPAAFRLQMPVLYTRTDELPGSVVDFMEDAEVERVVVVGSEAEVSASVTDELEELGAEVSRIDGADAAARSVALVKALGKCGDEELPLVANTFALVSADTPIDGVAAAGALAYGLGLKGSDEALVPVLMVGDDGVLPDAVAAHLASIPVLVGPWYQNVTLVALGGTSRITTGLMDAALAAATTSEPLTAAITAQGGSSTVTVKFSSAVNAADAGLRANYRVAGSALFGSDDVTYNEGTQTTTITLGNYKLAAGDEVQVLGGKIGGDGVGSRQDQRKVAAASAVVEAGSGGVGADRIRPRLRILAPAGSTVVRVLVTEANPGTDEGNGNNRGDALGPDEIKITVGGTLVARDGTKSGNERNPHVIGVFPLPNNAGYDVSWGCSRASSVSDCSGEISGTERPLAVGDRVEVVAGAIVDANDNASRLDVERVTANATRPSLSGSPQLSAVTVKTNAAKQPLNASATFGDDNEDSTASPATTRRLWFTITARSDGKYGGALGNGWRLHANLTADEDTDPDKLNVVYDERRQHITLNFDDEASVADMVTALRADAGFAANFAVTQNATADTDYTMPAGTPQMADEAKMDTLGRTVAFSGGQSTATLTLTFRDVLKSFDTSEFDNAQTVGGPFRTETMNNTVEADYSAFSAPGDVVTITYTYTSSNVPTATSTINLPAGVATNYSDATNTARNKIKLR